MTTAGHNSTRRTPAHHRSGFTLLEALVAIGAVALVAVGLAQIFRAVGDTVSGGRSASRLNTYAALIENQMRRDFERMTRDGFLVIRNQWVDGVDGSPDGLYRVNDPSDRVLLHAEDLSPRGRRVDEIVFFARGEFTSAREPVDPNVVVKADAARIYYGHGQARPENLTAGSPYLDPRPDDFNATGAFLGFEPPPGNRNPNQFASEWTLLRHALLLTQPRVTAADEVKSTLFGLPPQSAAGRRIFGDKEAQIGLQPAAASIFRAINRTFPVTMDPADYLRPESPRARPLIASGLIDIATTDLEEIRNWVVASEDPPRRVTPGALTVLPKPKGQFGIVPDSTSRAGETNDLDRMHLWMSDAFPAESQFFPFPGFAPSNPDPIGTRMRYEPEAVDLVAALSASNQNALKPAASRADKLMLTTANFLPRCSEFIVEYSFGQVYDNGEIVWLGLPRYGDTNGDGVVNPNTDDPVVQFYPAVDRDNSDLFLEIPFRTIAGQVARHRVSQRLIYGERPVIDQATLTSYFGYADPTFNPDRGTAGPSTDDAAESVMPWAWPTMIRVTITLSDPVDPSIEQTFQYIFNTPQANKR